MQNKSYTITGTVFSRQTKAGIANLRIEAWDEDLIFDDFVAEAKTDMLGRFIISFSSEKFKELFLDREPDIYFKIYSGETLVHNTIDSVLWNINKSLENLAISVDLKGETTGTAPTKINFTGTIKHTCGNVVPKIKVVLSEQKLRNKKSLAETITGEDGLYNITINAQGDSLAFVIDVKDDENNSLAASETIFKPKVVHTVNLVVSDVRYKGKSLFELNKEKLNVYWEELKKKGEKTNISIEDTLFIARQTGINAREVFHWMKACEIGDETKVPAEAFYGLFKQDMPSNISALKNVSIESMKIALGRSADENYISTDVFQKADSIIQSWNNYLALDLLIYKDKNFNSSLSDIIGLVVSDEKQKKEILSAYVNNKGNLENFWNNLHEITGSDQSAQQIQAAVRISALCGFQKDLSNSLLTDSKNKNSGDAIKSLAEKSEIEWVNYITALSKKIKKTAVPDFISEGDETARIHQFAKTIFTVLNKQFPTQSFFGQLKNWSGQNNPFEKTQVDLNTFYKNNPSFNLKTTPTISLSSSGKNFDFNGIKQVDSLISELQSIQRLNSYTSDFKSILTLKSDGLDAAYHITKMPEAEFIQTYSPILGSIDGAYQVYKKAAKNLVQSSVIWSNCHPNLNTNTAVATCAYTAAIASAELRTMFGSLDACECEHCTSVYSAAAYYTDILNFLYSRTSDVYNELIRRRPDLPKVELTCENTHTPLPYVDLVNELLENYILSKDSATTLPETSNQTTWQSSELAANPEHLNYEAYEKLENEVFPQELPFNMPLEETRVYLKHLGLQKHQVMASFFAGTDEETFDDFAIGVERLGFSPQEIKIITGLTVGDTSSNSGMWNFYGFDKESGYRALTDPLDSGKSISGGTWIEALSSRVDVFLQQTNIVYKDLLQMLLCDFINPLVGDSREISIVAKETDENGLEVNSDTCELHLLELEGLKEKHLKNIHRFLRMWRKLGWTMYDLDKVITTFTLETDDETGWRELIGKISQTKFLITRFKLPLDVMLSFWADIGSVGYIDYFGDNYPTLPSLYEKLFRNKSVINPIDEAFTESPTGLTGTLDDHLAAVLAALQISYADYSYLKADPTVITNTDLTIENLSGLYRNALLAKKTKLSIEDFLKLKTILGEDPFVDPLSVFSFLLKTDYIKTSGFNINQIDYILRHNYLDETGIAPDDNTISVFLSELRASLRALESSTEDEQKNIISQKFSEKLKITTTAATLLLQTYVKSTASSTIVIQDDFWARDFSTIDFLKTYKNSADLEFEPTFNRESDSTDATIVAVPTLFNNYQRLDKISTLINKLKLSDTDLENILINYSKIGCVDLSSLPVTLATTDFEKFNQLIYLIKARDILPIGSLDYFDILNEAIKNSDKEAWLNNLIARTNWDINYVEFLIGGGTALTSAGILKTNFPDDYCNGLLILQIKNGLNAIEKIGLSTDIIKLTLAEDVNDQLSQAIKNAAKAKHDEKSWAKIAKPLRDVLREKQRVALVAYAVYRPDSTKKERWKNTDELYEYFLIDVEMKPISMTSRIKQAICSLQLFIDRVLMNLEHPDTDLLQPALAMSQPQVDEWKEWRKIYRIWEANRKIFLYPENWLEPELRDDKSPFFTELEAKLRQDELNEENVENAFYNYLEKLDEVARLEVVGLYREKEDAVVEEDGYETEEAVDRLHVIARTYVSPHKYFHRTLEDGEWTSWTKLEIDIDGDHIVPIIFNRRLCLFWLFFTLESEEQGDLSTAAANSYWKIQMAWSEFKNNKWTAKKISKSYFESAYKTSRADLESIRKRILLHHYFTDEGLVFLPTESVYLEGSSALGGIKIYFRNTSTDPELLYNDDKFTLYNETPSNTQQNKMRLYEWENATDEKLYYATSVWPDRDDNPYCEYSPILEDSPKGDYNLAIPLEFDTNPLETQFFFQDKKSTFYVEHSTITKLVWDNDIEIDRWSDWGHEIWKEQIKIEKKEDTYGQYLSPEMFFKEEGLDYFSEYQKILETEQASSIQLSFLGTDKSSKEASRSILKGDRGNIISGKGSSKSKHTTTSNYFTFTTFYHAHVKTFIKELNKLGVDGLLKREVQIQSDDILFSDTYNPVIGVVNPSYPTSEIDFVYGGAYSQYNWELFFHVPMLIACRLSDDQRFEDARIWFHYIFDPTKSEGGDEERFWQFKPFYDEAGLEITTLDDLLRSTAELEAQIAKWMDEPFQPHVIARMRKTAYMKNVVMKYLDNMIAWGDQLFRRDTIESINEATNLYILASKILGEKPQQIPPRAEHDDACFDDIKDELDPFSNAMVSIETFISPSSSSGGSSSGSNALGEMFYFCVPGNEQLLKYWDTVADRLFKIRNSMNIEGVVRLLPLFEPPIDPAMLVRAAAAGMDLSSILSDMNVALPNYRFSFMLQKANELVNDVKSLGSSLLQALEKRDAEAFSLLRSGHEQKVLNAMLSIKEKQVDDTKEALESAKKSLEITIAKQKYYSSRSFMNSYETQNMKSMQLGMVLSMVQGEINMISGTLSAIPNFKLGAPTSIGATFGGDNLGAVMGAISSYLGIVAGLNSASGAMASTYGGYTRRMDDWKFQADTATKEITMAEHQILSSEIKLAIAEKEVSNQKLQIENSLEADEFMRSKFSNQQLYDWMIGQISTVYFQSYQLAYDIAKQAEQCYQYELGEYNQTSFIQFGYWDSLKKGLLSAEKLQYDLRRMETSFYEKNIRELELSKNISLLLTNPQAIVDLRNNGKCVIVIPEEIFDLDYQGHYFRRLKSVSLSIPCIAGPYTTIGCTLRLLKHTTRLETSASPYESSDYAADDRFRHVTSEIRSIAASTAQNDSGIFELNFRDERYLPFEGCGVFGEWEIVLNEDTDLRLFDYNTISDAIMHFKYTARDGGGTYNDTATFKGVVVDYLKNLISATVEATNTANGLQLWRMFSCKHDFPSEWYKLFHPSNGTDYSMNFELAIERFPFYAQEKEVEIVGVKLAGTFTTGDTYDVVITSNAGDEVAFSLKNGETVGNASTLPADFGLGDFTLTIMKSGSNVAEDQVKDIIIMFDYQLKS